MKRNLTKRNYFKEMTMLLCEMAIAGDPELQEEMQSATGVDYQTVKNHPDDFAATVRAFAQAKVWPHVHKSLQSDCGEAMLKSSALTFCTCLDVEEEHLLSSEIRSQMWQRLPSQIKESFNNFKEINRSGDRPEGDNETDAERLAEMITAHFDLLLSMEEVAHQLLTDRATVGLLDSKRSLRLRF